MPALTATRAPAEKARSANRGRAHAPGTEQNLLTKPPEKKGALVAAGRAAKAAGVGEPPTVPRARFDFGQISIHPPAPRRVQKMAAISRAGDVHEQEADRLSAEVADMSPAYADTGAFNAVRPTKVLSSGGYKAGLPASVEQVLRSPGRPLEPATRAFMEPRFGLDFSKVRIHTDSHAAESARALGALAYASGQHIAFDAGRYVPGSAGGRQLLAHELTHVVQQGRISPHSGFVQRQAAPDTADPWANLTDVDREIAGDQLDTANSYLNLLAIAQQKHNSLRRKEWIDQLHVLAAQIAAVDRPSKLLDIESEIPAYTDALDKEANKYQNEWVAVEKRYKSQHSWLLSRSVKSIDSVEAATYLEQIYNQTKQRISFYPTDEDYAELKNVLDQGRDVQIGSQRGARIRFAQLKQMMDVVADLIRDREDPEKFVPKWQERVAEETAHLDALSKDAEEASKGIADPLRKENTRGYSVEMAGIRDELLAKQQETLQTKPRPEESTLGKAYDLVHGAASAFAGIFVEAAKEAVDLIQINIHFVTLGKYTPHFISDMAAAAEQGATTGDLLKGMVTNALQTPSRFLQACRDGDWDAVGRETLNLYFLADTLKGLPEAVRRFPETLDRVRELGEKLPELIAKTHESLRILRARSVALALKNEGRLRFEPPKAPVHVEPPKVQAAPPPAAPVHLNEPPRTPTPPKAPAPPVRAVPDPPDMVRTPPTAPKGQLQSVGKDGSLGPSRGAGRQPPPPAPGKAPSPKGQVAANDNAQPQVQTQQLRRTGTGGAGDTVMSADKPGGKNPPVPDGSTASPKAPGSTGAGGDVSGAGKAPAAKVDPKTGEATATADPSAAKGTPDPTPKTVPPTEDTVWVQLEDGRVSAYKPSEVKGALKPGADAVTADGKGRVVHVGKEAPHSGKVVHDPDPLPPNTVRVRNMTTTDVENLKSRGYLFEKSGSDGRTVTYRHPETGRRVEIILRRGGPDWLEPEWGRARIEAELKKRGFILGRETRAEGGRLYRNPTTTEEIRIMSKPGEMNRNEPIEKHLNDSYYRYRPNNSVEWGDHTTILDKK